MSRKTAVILETNEEQGFKVSFASSILSAFQIHESLLGVQTRSWQHHNILFHLVKKDLLAPQIPTHFPNTTVANKLKLLSSWDRKSTGKQPWVVPNCLAQEAGQCQIHRKRRKEGSSVHAEANEQAPPHLMMYAGHLLCSPWQKIFSHVNVHQIFHVDIMVCHTVRNVGGFSWHHQHTATLQLGAPWRSAAKGSSATDLLAKTAVRATKP